MKQINYKSDFDLIATIKAYDTEGNEVEIGFMNYDWEIELYTGCNNYASRNYKVSYIGGKATNCFNDNGKVHIICDNHKMNIGALNGVVKAYIPNAIYPDGHQLIVAPLNFSIELVEDAGDSPTPIDVTISLPYFYDSAYHQAVQGGYQGTQEEYFALVSQLPNAVEVANSVKDSAEYLRASATSLSNSASTIGTSADKIEGNVDAITNASKVLSEKSEILGESAETIGNASTALESLASEWVSGRKAIATALTNRKYPTEPTESFADMAQKITDMSYGLGIFEKIGYTESNNDIAEKVNYADELAKGWNPDGSTVLMFRGNKKLVFSPLVDTINVTNMTNMFNGCYALSAIPQLDTKNVTSMYQMFYECYALSTIPLLDTSNVTNMSGMFYSCFALSTIPQLDTSNVTNMSGMFNKCNALSIIPQLDTSKVTAFNGMFDYSAVEKIESLDLSSATNVTSMIRVSSLKFALLKNIGKSSLATYDFSGATNWGIGSEENRQSLIDTLITYSYDRVSAGMKTVTITLSANTKALLTEEEIAQITQKGYTIA